MQSLSNFPPHLGDWTLVQSRQSSAEVVKMLGVDDYIDYTYSDKENDVVNLYVAFYESVGGGKGYHSPKNCLPGGGWGIERVRTVRITPGFSHGRPVTIAEMLIRNGSEYQVVFYWFQNRGRIISSEYWEKIYLVLDALLKKRRDGSFIRIMAYARDGNIEEAERKLKDFAELSMTELAGYLPGA